MQKQENKITLGIAIAALVLLSIFVIGLALAFYISPFTGITALVGAVSFVIIKGAINRAKSRKNNLVQSAHMQEMPNPIPGKQTTNSATTSIFEQSKTTNNIPQRPEGKSPDLVSETLDTTNFGPTSISQLDKPTQSANIKNLDPAKKF